MPWPNGAPACIDASRPAPTAKAEGDEALTPSEGEEETSTDTAEAILTPEWEGLTMIMDIVRRHSKPRD